jgi:Rrf2 family protein
MQEHIPRKFLETILLELKNKAILISKKGKGGGYFLARDPAHISVGDLIRALDGPLAPVPCVSQTAYRRCEECRNEDTCGIRLVMQDVREATAQVMDRASLLDVLNREERLTQQKRQILVYAI